MWKLHAERADQAATASACDTPQRQPRAGAVQGQEEVSKVQLPEDGAIGSNQLILKEDRKARLPGPWIWSLSLQPDSVGQRFRRQMLQ